MNQTPDNAILPQPTGVGVVGVVIIIGGHRV